MKTRATDRPAAGWEKSRAPGLGWSRLLGWCGLYACKEEAPRRRQRRSRGRGRSHAELEVETLSDPQTNESGAPTTQMFWVCSKAFRISSAICSRWLRRFQPPWAISSLEFRDLCAWRAFPKTPVWLQEIPERISTAQSVTLGLAEARRAAQRWAGALPAAAFCSA